jgi:hypothetical protein
MSLLNANALPHRLRHCFAFGSCGASAPKAYNRPGLHCPRSASYARHGPNHTLGLSPIHLGCQDILSIAPYRVRRLFPFYSAFQSRYSSACSDFLAMVAQRDLHPCTTPFSGTDMPQRHISLLTPASVSEGYFMMESIPSTLHGLWWHQRWPVHYQRYSCRRHGAVRESRTCV